MMGEGEATEAVDRKQFGAVQLARSATIPQSDMIVSRTLPIQMKITQAISAGLAGWRWVGEIDSCLQHRPLSRPRLLSPKIARYTPTFLWQSV